MFGIPFINLTPFADVIEEAKRKNRIRIALAALAAFVLFLILRKK